jgi:hypothetical protein
MLKNFVPETNPETHHWVILKVKPDLTVPDLSWAIESAKLIKKFGKRPSPLVLCALFITLWSQVVPFPVFSGYSAFKLKY